MAVRSEQQSRAFRFGMENAIRCSGQLGGGTMLTHKKQILVMLLAVSIGGAAKGIAQEPDQTGEPPSSGWHRFGEQRSTAPLPPPSNLTLPAGTWITVRVDQMLSSDRNKQGDAFTATLAQPLVADGRVIARRGQMMGGVVASAEKAGRVKGTSRLGVELTELGLVDGRQVQVRTTLMERRGDTSMGRDAGAIAATTGIGAAIGAAAEGGVGAGIGAIAGAAASTIGVLVTRGTPTIVSPEDVLTFRLEVPLTVSTAASGPAFQPVTQEDYDQPTLVQRGPSQGPPPPAYYGGYYSPYYYGRYYSPYFSFGFYPGFYYGSSFYFHSHPHYSYHGGYYHGGGSHHR
jgi:hypothetical protein